MIVGNLAGRDGITPNGPFDVAVGMRGILRAVRKTRFIVG